MSASNVALGQWCKSMILARKCVNFKIMYVMSIVLPSMVATMVYFGFIALLAISPKTMFTRGKFLHEVMYFTFLHLFFKNVP